MNYPWVSRGVPSPSCLLTQFLLPQSWPAVMGLLLQGKLELNSCPCHPTAGRVWATPVKLLQERAISFLLLFGDSGYFCDRNRDNIAGIWWTYFMCFLMCSYYLKAFFLLFIEQNKSQRQYLNTFFWGLKILNKFTFACCFLILKYMEKLHTVIKQQRNKFHEKEFVILLLIKLIFFSGEKYQWSCMYCKLIK